MKAYDQVFNLQKRMLLIREIFLICEFLSDSQAIHEDSLSLILLIELNFAYLVSDKLSSDLNSLVVDSIKLSSVVQSFDCVNHQVNEFL